MCPFVELVFVMELFVAILGLLFWDVETDCVSGNFADVDKSDNADKRLEKLLSRFSLLSLLQQKTYQQKI